MPKATTETTGHLGDSPDPRNAAPDLAARRAAATRQVIVDAVSDLLVEQHPAALSVPAVARRAGVSVRTVYRYFPTKQDLLDAVAEVLPAQASIPAPRDWTDPRRAERQLSQLWDVLAENMPAVRAQHTSAAGREVREQRLARHCADVDRAMVAALPDAPDADRATLRDLSIAVTSSSMFLELVDRLGHDPTDAARLASWVSRAILREYRQNGFDR